MNGFHYLDISEPEFRFIKLLNAHAVRYLVIGGVAAVYYGRRRPAEDLDILADNSIDNAPRLLAAVDGLRPQKGITSATLTQPKRHLRLTSLGYYQGNRIKFVPRFLTDSCDPNLPVSV